jgi:hypothetical protein
VSAAATQIVFQLPSPPRRALPVVAETAWIATEKPGEVIMVGAKRRPDFAG